MSKSRSDRGKTPNLNQNAPATQNVIIPGKFMENDWNELLESETGEEFIFGIVSEIADHACNEIFSRIIDHRVQPYCISAAKLLLLDIIEWQFLTNDVGEVNTTEEASWVDDDEPKACITDSWAQGAVPIQPAQAHSLLSRNTSYVATDVLLKHNAEDMEDGVTMTTNDVAVLTTDKLLIQDKRDIEDADTVIENVSDELNVEDKLSHALTVEEQLSDELTVQGQQSHLNLQPELPVENKTKTTRRKKFKPYGGSVPKFRPISLTPVTDDRPKPGVGTSSNDLHPLLLHSSESLLRTQHGRPPGTKDVIYDDEGNVLYVQKLNTANLPNHRIKPKYTVLDPTHEANKKLRLTSKQQQLVKKQTNNNNNNTIENSTLLRSLYSQDFDVIHGLRTPLPPPMVDTIDVSAGVSVREGTLLKQGPKKKTYKNIRKEEQLHPISSSSTRVLDVTDIMKDSSPAIRPLSMSNVLPAIY